MGYVKGASLPSLIAGGIFGALLLTASHRIFRNKGNGEKLALLFILALDAFFTYRFAKHPNLMPAGLMLIVSNFMLIMLIIGIRKKARIHSSSD